MFEENMDELLDPLSFLFTTNKEVGFISEC